MIRQWVSVLAVMLPGAAVLAGDIPFGDRDRCMDGPMAQFGRYIGNWVITDEALSRETGEWEPGEGARWNFVCLGNGIAVQDFWMPADGRVGTNLRTYNAPEGRWDIAWAFDGTPGFAHIQAEQTESGNIVMYYKAPLPNPLRRITFFPPDEDGWNWHLEMSWDDGESWREVYRIRATPGS